MNRKEQKLKEAVKEVAAEFFGRESDSTTLITVTDVELKSHNAKAVIMITVLPESQEKLALEFMQRRLSDFRAYFGEKVKIMRMPLFELAIDKGEKNRQKIDSISKF